MRRVLPKSWLLVGPTTPVPAGVPASITVLSEDINGNPLIVSPSALTLTTSAASATAKTCATSSCATQGSVVIQNGATSSTFFYLNTAVATVQVTVTSASGLSASTFVQTVANVPGNDPG